MHFQPYQLLQLVIYLSIPGIFFKSKNSNVKIACAVIALIVFTVNPVRHVERGGSSLESSINRFKEVPEITTVQKESFKQRQEAQMLELKTQSENMTNEIHN